MRLALIGKFKKMHDEEYIARSFEMLGHEVIRVNERFPTYEIIELLDFHNPDLVMWTKLMVADAKQLREHCRKWKTVCWVFDLYWGYDREYRLKSHPAFTADYVFTTDGGHNEDFKGAGINHKCVRQGIWHEEAVLISGPRQHDVVFVGSENPLHPTRAKQIDVVSNNFGFKWFGRLNTNEVRGLDLNRLYGSAGVVIGDSVYSPYYWSNRVVETLGRGGFLIHQEVEGLKEEYPHLVTYQCGNWDELKEKIGYYLNHEDERQEIIKKNFEWVRDHYTMEKQCRKLLNYIS